MIRRLVRFRALRRRSAVIPNPRGVRMAGLRPVRRPRRALLAVLLLGLAAAGGWAARDRGTGPQGPTALVACGGGRWVSDPARCP